MKKTLLTIISAITTCLIFTSCFDPIFSDIRNEVPLKEAQISGFINSIVRYKNSSMYVIGTGVMNTNSGEVTSSDLYRFLQNAKRFFKYIVIDTDKSKYDINQYLFTHADEVFYLITQNKEALDVHREFLENKNEISNLKVILSKFRRKMKEDFHSLISDVETLINTEIYHFIPNCVLTTSKTMEQKCTLSELNITPVPEIVVSYNKLIRKIIGVMKT